MKYPNPLLAVIPLVLTIQLAGCVHPVSPEIADSDSAQPISTPVAVQHTPTPANEPPTETPIVSHGGPVKDYSHDHDYLGCATALFPAGLRDCALCGQR
jgi:hypothetical protein